MIKQLLINTIKFVLVLLIAVYLWFSISAAAISLRGKSDCLKLPFMVMCIYFNER